MTQHRTALSSATAAAVLSNFGNSAHFSCTYRAEILLQAIAALFIHGHCAQVSQQFDDLSMYLHTCSVCSFL